MEIRKIFLPTNTAMLGSDNRETLVYDVLLMFWSQTLKKSTMPTGLNKKKQRHPKERKKNTKNNVVLAQ